MPTQNAIDMVLTNSPCDELAVLAAEVNDGDGLFRIQVSVEASYESGGCSV